MSEIYTGSNVIIDNLNNSKAKIKVNGKSWQETRSGKNLLKYPYSGSFTYDIFSDNGDGSIKLEGELGGVVSKSFVANENFSAGTYRLSSGIGTLPLASYWLVQNADTSEYIVLTGSDDQNFVLDEATNIHINIVFRPGTYNKTILYPMVEKTTATTTSEWEAYGASPSPEYPSRIRNVGDDINLFDGEIQNGLYLAATGNFGNSDYYVCSKEPMQVNGGETITVSNKFKKTGVYYVIELDENKAYIKSQDSVQIVEDFTCTLGDTTKYILLDLGNSSTGACRVENVGNFKVQLGEVATAYSPYGYGSVEIEKVNKNLVITENCKNATINADGTLTIAENRLSSTYIPINSEKPMLAFSMNTEMLFLGLAFYDKNKVFIKREAINNNNKIIASIPDNAKYAICFINTTEITFNEQSFYTYELQLEYETVTPYTPHQSETFVFPVAEPLHEGDYLADTIVNNRKTRVLNGTENWVLLNADSGQYFLTGLGVKPSSSILCSHFVDCKAWQLENGIFVGSSGAIGLIYKGFTTLDELKNWLSENPVTVEYELATPITTPYTAEQENIYNQLQNIKLYEGINHINILSDIDPELTIMVKKMIEDYKFYITSNGRLIIPELDIDYLVDLNESSIPSMPEAAEASVRVAGRDGDIPLKTTYEPISFNIICYTEDNLSLYEKVKEENKIKKFLNLIKNKFTTFAIEKDGKFYYVKYNGALTTINFPKHLKFSIPLKSAESYAKDLFENSIVGNGQKESETIEETGAIFTIVGPAQTPIITLNDYIMEYSNVLLEGDKLVIDSNKSTVTHINAVGIKTNAMRYYNHQFPKIKNGNNELKILSGIDNAVQVSAKWYDLKL